MKIYVRQGSEGYWLGDVSAFPGCNASGTSRDEAIANTRTAFRAYRELLAARGVSTEHVTDVDPDTLPVDDAPTSGMLPGDDTKLEEHEIRDFLHQFEASRAALISLLRGLSPDELEKKPTESMWSVREALEHMLQTDVTLLARLEKWPTNPFATLQAVHRLAFQRFSVMEPDDWVDHTVQGRRWTTRRVMRRLLEHEYEHYGHIKEIMAALGSDRPPE
ncbi:MAG: type II toxin-antitoxin system HicB family antitoxin [Chloroflexota bacterium]|nr:type II toxin-antitoxin system HicB family antitoxin [Chloroflexota bacterium]